MRETRHSKLQVIIASYIHTRRKAWRVWAMTEQRIRVQARRVRVPNVCIVSSDRPLPRVLVNPPLACIEVVSDCDTLRSIKPRMVDYNAMGVQHLWILNPETIRNLDMDPSVCSTHNESSDSGHARCSADTELFDELNDTDF